MSDQEILEKAIQKAIDGGWKLPLGDVVVPNKSTWPHDADEIFAYFGTYRMPQWMIIIFNHDFAKALWGDKEMIAYRFHSALSRESTDLLESGACFIWQFHLQQMVIADDPIKYLGENI